MNDERDTVTERFTPFYGGPLSQWEPAPFVAGGVTFTCAEQYMMAMKAVLFEDQETYRLIMAAEHPREQKRLGRRVANFDLARWEAHREQIVLMGNLLKFGTHPLLMIQLLQTHGTTLVEASPYDLVWGVGLRLEDPLCHDRSAWRGKNLLGVALTRARLTFEAAALASTVLMANNRPF